MNNIDNTHLLFDLESENYTIIKSYLDNIDYNKITGEETIQCIAPVIRTILCNILITSQQFLFSKRIIN